MNALTGIPCTSIEVEGVVIGRVFQSRYLIDFQADYQLDKIRILEKGITIEVIHR